KGVRVGVVLSAFCQIGGRVGRCCLAGGEQGEQRQCQYRQGFHSADSSVLLLGEGAGDVASAFQHFTSVLSNISSSGATRWQWASASGQRGWNGQPLGRLIG